MKFVVATFFIVPLTGVALAVPDTTPPLDPKVKALVQTLRTAPKWEDRFNAAEELGEIKAEGAVPALAEALRNDKEPNVRFRAATSLGKMEAGARTAVPSLVGALKDEAPYTGRGRGSEPTHVCNAALTGLRGIGTAAKEAIPAVMGIVRTSKDQNMRKAAVHALGRIGIQDDHVLALLLDIVGDEKDELVVRSVAVSSLEPFGVKAKVAVPDLIKLLKAEYPKDTRVADGAKVNAARALKTMGPEARKALPALRQALREAKAEWAVRDLNTSIEEIEGKGN